MKQRYHTENIYIYIYIYIYKENLAKLHKRKINYILEKKKKKNYCSGEGLEGNVRTIRVHPKTTEVSEVTVVVIVMLRMRGEQYMSSLHYYFIVSKL